MYSITKSWLFAMLLFTCVTYAQVGIGTTDPDPSALLELDSNSQGFLTPRMSSIDRLNISSPEEGLLVYDTDERAFYYFSSGSWSPITSSEKRDNYKMVKSIADLSDELIAGGGSTYLLTPNFLYEINGTITVDFPIEINGAYIMGEDSNDDALVNNTGATLFIGNTGGVIRRLTIDGNSNQIFNIDGGDIASISSVAVSYKNASSLGSLINLKLFYLTTSNFINNTDGFNLEKVSSVFMTLFLWVPSNSGTFLDLSGTFDEIQISNSRINTDAGEVGIDVSNNPTINRSASIAQVSFDGTGQNINPYTVGAYNNFNFSDRWYVEAQGIPRETDGTASGNFYYTGNLVTGFLQTISNGTAVEVQGSGIFATNSLFRFSASGGNNRLMYNGNKQREFTVNTSMSVRVTNAAGNYYAFAIAKNGTLITESNSVVYISNDSQIQSVSLNANVSLDNGDYIEVFVQRLTGSGNDTLAVFSENLSIR